MTDELPLPVFSDAWARACADTLGRSEAYQAAAATWEGAIMLVMTGEGDPAGDRRVFLDLWRGECRAARAADLGDEASARYVLSGTRASWQVVLTGAVAPLLAVMTGRLKLTKGSLADLVPYVGVAKELVAAASAVRSVFPP